MALETVAPWRRSCRPSAFRQSPADRSGTCRRERGDPQCTYTTPRGTTDERAQTTHMDAAISLRVPARSPPIAPTSRLPLYKKANVRLIRGEDGFLAEKIRELGALARLSHAPSVTLRDRRSIGCTGFLLQAGRSTRD
jgi:hypothetical protein